MEQHIPIVGDRSFHGWITFAAYMVVSALCIFNARRCAAAAGDGGKRAATARARRRFWYVLWALLLLLGLTRQLDLQTMLTDAIRHVFRESGWYDGRADLQRGIAMATAFLGSVGLIIGLVAFRRAEGSVLTAMGGAAIMVTFVLIRTISLHDIDHFLNRGVAGGHVENIVGLGALLLIAVAAVAFQARLRDEHRTSQLRALSIQQRRRRLEEERRLAGGTGGAS